MLTKVEQYQRIDTIVRVACEVGEISYPELIGKEKSLKKNVLRGVVYIISRYYLVHPRITASVMCRTRQNIINVARNYHKYLQSKDELTTHYFNLITKKIEEDGIRTTSA